MIISNDTIDILKKFFVFDRIFNLICYDHDMNKLYEELRQLKQDKYQNNYRFIFLFYDTQYYITNSSSGLTLLNLQRILHQLDIPNYFCLILSQQPIAEELNRLRITETTDDCSIDSIVYYNYYFATEIFNDASSINPELEINEHMICSKYQSLNRIKRFHRRVLFSILKDKNLLDHGAVSYNGLGNNQHD